MSDVEIIIPPENETPETPPIVKDEGDTEWKILLGEMKAKLEWAEEKLKSLSADAEELRNRCDSMQSSLETHQSATWESQQEQNQRLTDLEAMEIVEEVPESTPEKAAPLIVESQNEEESQEQVRKRRKLIV
jgi:multidrug resistance efflux pump